MRLFLTLLIGVMVSGCSVLPHIYREREKGLFWCNNIYKESEDRTRADKRRAEISLAGYPYITAAALTLQKQDVESLDHWIGTPRSMTLIERIEMHDFSGFAADIYEYISPQGEKQIIIAFRGSDDLWDWLFANILASQSQLMRAKDLVISVSEEPYAVGKKIIVTGISLGGALAIHVAKDEKTGALIYQAWAGNPSPNTWANGKRNDKIWLVYMKREFLAEIRRQQSTLPWRLPINARMEQTAVYDGIASTSLYAHFRYVLLRDMLHIAQVADEKLPTGLKTGEPAEFIKNTDFYACEASRRRKAVNSGLEP
ncbi:hypothetical protein [Paracidovorax oryzae]|uniref:hypothetical protein n=1 Tax=Paracidovorax oryzae TaxID=862720 RepID=UPI001ADEDDFA|nr:hypothetical protein [Paracidovorax oryzae]